jgi:hypothetical protein
MSFAASLGRMLSPQKRSMSFPASLDSRDALRHSLPRGRKLARNAAQFEGRGSHSEIPCPDIVLSILCRRRSDGSAAGERVLTALL